MVVRGIQLSRPAVSLAFVIAEPHVSVPIGWAVFALFDGVALPACWLGHGQANGPTHVAFTSFAFATGCLVQINQIILAVD